MNCQNCGNSCKEGARFCPKCGAELLAFSNSENPNTDTDFSQGDEKTGSKQSKETKNQTFSPREMNRKYKSVRRKARRKKGKRIAIIVIIIIATAAVAAGYFYIQNKDQEETFQDHMDAGQKYLAEEAYEEAVDEFTEAIEIDDKVVEPYEYLAEAYTGLGDTDMVEETYDTVRSVIVSEYEDSGELLENSKELYMVVIVYYGEQGNTAEAEEWANEILSCLTDEEDIEEVTALLETYSVTESEEEEDEETESEETEVVDEKNAEHIITSLDEVPEDAWMQMQEKAASVLEYTLDKTWYAQDLRTTDAPTLVSMNYLGSYFFTNESGDDCLIYPIFRIQMNQHGDEFTYYWYIEFYNPMYLADGTFSMNYSNYSYTNRSFIYKSSDNIELKYGGFLELDSLIYVIVNNAVNDGYTSYTNSLEE